ncbi:integrator complex subunit 14-like [Oppia nitens]|uniref:integrator complex subunit 14-like n=1 Tax=Oppia nitens TaxID=1686743 RepID=UPI0023DCC26F|nr:integrator complex subunit 14-like [Oppia nitens]
MPTIILLDVSLSMCRMVPLNDNNNDNQMTQLKSLAIHGLNALLDYESQNARLEFTSLMVFSSLWQILSKFTRDYDQLKAALHSIELFDKTSFVNALRGVKNMVLEEWGSEMACNVILVTDGNAAINAHLMNSSNGNKIEESTDEDTDDPVFPLPFPFPAKLHIVCLTTINDNSFQKSLPFFAKLIELNSNDSIKEPFLVNHLYSGGQVWVPEGNQLSYKSVQNVFNKLAESNYRSFKGRLYCGMLSSPISLYPSLDSYIQIRDFETIKAEPSEDISICGFMDIAEVSSPPVHSRHLVLPLQESKEEVRKTATAMVSNPNNPSDCGPIDFEDLLTSMCADEGRQPSFTVLLHGSLKVEGMVAICQVGTPNWYGMLYSWADNKKKSNLMLSTFKCGAESIPWLTNLKSYGFPSINIQKTPQEINVINEKKSFSQGCVVWLKQAFLQSDIQKILRHARKLPEKTAHFYKELNRLRRAALSFGFYALIEGLASILERECRMLPGTAHPEAALQLTHAVSCLRQPRDADCYNQCITPLETNFNK